MTYVVIGLTVGIVMGLTGAGGALISIPLFVSLLGASLKEATVLSLIAVVFGTSINLIGNFSKIDKRVTSLLGFSGVTANYASGVLKSSVPDLLVAGLLTTISIYSLWTVWSSNKASSTDDRNQSVILKSFLTGTLLGILTTFTGLGGGVLLIPLLMRLLGKSYDEVLPTSLATIFLISLTSFVFQFGTAFQLISYSQLVTLGMGAVLGFLSLKAFIGSIDASRVEGIRKVVFSLVTVYSAISILVQVI